MTHVLMLENNFEKILLYLGRGLTPSLPHVAMAMTGFIHVITNVPMPRIT